MVLLNTNDLSSSHIALKIQETNQDGYHSDLDNHSPTTKTEIKFSHKRGMLFTDGTEIAASGEISKGAFRGKTLLVHVTGITFKVLDTTPDGDSSTSVTVTISPATANGTIELEWNNSSGSATLTSPTSPSIHDGNFVAAAAGDNTKSYSVPSSGTSGGTITVRVRQNSTILTSLNLTSGTITIDQGDGDTETSEEEGSGGGFA